MAEQFGNGVSRTLSALERSFSNVVWQQGKPPLDSELNLVGQLGWESISDQIREQMPSGFLINPALSDKDYSFHALGSNYFELGENGELTAVVNGWVIPITGTNKDALGNAIKLAPPPTSNARTDFVFLEVFRVLLEASPSTDNKPSNSTVWRYGNTLYGRSDNPTEDMIDGAIGFETTRRVQVQHRIRVVSGIDIGRYPEGMNSTAVLGRGTSASPVNGLTFSNVTGDAGLWRAGDGDPANDLGTVDGYVYAVPICAVFRRNSSSYVSVSNAGIPEHNGAPNRTPSFASASEAVVLTQLTLTGALASSSTGAVQVTNLSGSGLDDAGLYVSNRFVTIGEGLNREVLEVSGSDTGTGTLTIVSRGRAGTEAKYHPAGSPISLYNERYDGLYSDQIARQDVMDLRHSVLPVNYESLLQSSVMDVLSNQLNTTFKTSANGSDSKGVVIEEVSVLGGSYNHTQRMDAPDGIRTIWSDASVYQSNITLMLDFGASAIDGDGYLTSSYNATIANQWSSAPDFHPTGWIYTDRVIRKGTTISLKLGGQSGAQGARRGINTTATNLVRFVHPREMAGKRGDTDPFKLRLFGGVKQRRGYQSYPLPGVHRQNVYLNQEVEGYDEDTGPDFMVFGDSILTRAGISAQNTDLKYLVYSHDNGNNSTSSTGYLLVNMGVDFDATNQDEIVSLKNIFENPTLYNLLTDYGNDLTGRSSELYLHLYGDSGDKNNNGAFKIVGMGSITPLSEQITALGGGPTWVYLERIGNDSFFTFNNATGATNITGSIRLQYLRSNDEQAVIVITATDLEATSDYGILSCALQWPSGQGAVPRTPDVLNRVEVLNTSTGYSKNRAYALDSNPSDLVLPNVLEMSAKHHLSTLPALGNQGFEFSSSVRDEASYVSIGGSEDSIREADCYFDTGSKTLVLRPFRRHTMSIESTGFILSYDSITDTETTGPAIDATYSDGITPVDGGDYFTSARTAVYAVPIEALPSFGRQDIPYHVRENSSDPILEGLNHLFLDTTSQSDEIFNIIGGEENNGAPGVYPAIFGTSTALGTYGQYVTSAGIANQEGYVARKTVISSERFFYSDFPFNVGGIELPPYMGFARVYGVYESADFIAKVANGNRGAHLPDRITPLVGGPTNLLRKDATDYTMFIKEDGGQDLLNKNGAHTYILTENALNLSKIPGYVDGQVFDDFDYVVECVIFGFAEDFISNNNLVLTRRYSGNGVALNDAVASVLATADLQPNEHILNAEMIFPSALPHGSEVVVSYKRTVYQGDPYHTRDGSTPQYADNPVRLGQLDPALSYSATQTRTIREEDGTLAVELSNPRRLEVLSSMDFYTTLGSGAIGGSVKPSTFSDVGFLSFQGNRNVARLASLNGEYAESKLSVFTEVYSRPSEGESATLILSEDSYPLIAGTANNAGGNAVLRITIEDTKLFETATYDIRNFGGTFDNSVNDLVKTMNDKKYRVDILRSLDKAYLFISTKELGHFPERFKVSVSWFDTATNTSYPDIERFVKLHSGRYYGVHPYREVDMRSSVFMSGGVSIPVNAGTGNIPLSMVGSISRLPIGLLVNDFDFLCEDPLNNQASFFKSKTAQTDYSSREELPLSPTGLPYTKVSGSSGEILEMTDGALYDYVPYNSIVNPGGTRRYRMSRGGGSLFGVSGTIAGGPVAWFVDRLQKSEMPVLKGGMLACRALLVRNTEETAYEGQDLSTKSNGGEIQLVLLTSAIYRDLNEDLVLDGSISPTGYGENFCASDRYRIKGRPLVKQRGDLPSESVEPASKAQRIYK